MESYPKEQGAQVNAISHSTIDFPEAEEQAQQMTKEQMEPGLVKADIKDRSMLEDNQQVMAVATQVEKKLVKCGGQAENDDEIGGVLE